MFNSIARCNHLRYVKFFMAVDYKCYYYRPCMNALYMITVEMEIMYTNRPQNYIIIDL